MGLIIALIIIGLIASSFAAKDRKRIILLGVFGAFLFRVIFAAITVQLLQYPILKVAFTLSLKRLW